MLTFWKKRRKASLWLPVLAAGLCLMLGACAAAPGSRTAAEETPAVSAPADDGVIRLLSEDVPQLAAAGVVYDVNDYDTITQGREVLKLIVKSTGDLPGDDYNAMNELRLEISDAAKGYVFREGDTLEYDVYCRGSMTNAGMVDLITEDLTSLMEDTDAADQNGLPLGTRQDRRTAFNMNDYASNQWYHREIRIPTEMVGKTVSRWTITTLNVPRNTDYEVLFDNICLTNGGQTVHTAYANGQLEKCWRLKRDPHIAFSLAPSLLAETHAEAFGSAIRVTGKTDKLTDGARATAEYTFSQAGKGQYSLKAGDAIYYKTKSLTPFMDGVGGIDICFTDGSKLTDYNVLDQVNYSILPQNDLSGLSYGSWFYRKIEVKGNLIGKTIDHWTINLDTASSETDFDVLYADVKLVNGTKTEVLAYGGVADGLTKIGETNMTSEASSMISTSNSGIPAKDVLCMKAMPTFENDVLTMKNPIDVSYVLKKTPVAIEQGYYLEYDVLYGSEMPANGGFGIGFTDETGAAVSFAGLMDQNGLPAQAITDLSRYAGSGWYHRRISLDTLAGKTIGEILLQYSTTDLTSGATAYFDNVRIVSDDQTILDAYRNGDCGQEYRASVKGYYMAQLSSMPVDVAKAESYDVMAFGAKADGVTDDTQAIQGALYTAMKNGGGIVTLPTGEFCVRGHLIVPAGVTLSGAGDETVLFAYESRNRFHGPCFITLEGSASVRSLAVYYPEQTNEAFIPYPYTIRNEFGDGSHLENLTLYNSYNGILLGTRHSKGQQLKNIKMTALRHGFVADVNDQTVIDGFTISPDVWMSSRYWPASGSAQIFKLGLTEQLEAFACGNSTNISISNLTVSYAKSAVQFSDASQVSMWSPYFHKTPHASNGSVTNLNIDHAVLGLEVNLLGGALTVDQGHIQAASPYFPLCMRIAKDLGVYSQNPVTVTGVTFESEGGCVEIIGSKSQTTFNNCSFAAWGSDYSCIDMQAGTISGTGTTFAREADQVLTRTENAHNNLGQ